MVRSQSASLWSSSGPVGGRMPALLNSPGSAAFRGLALVAEFIDRNELGLVFDALAEARHVDECRAGFLAAPHGGRIEMTITPEDTAHGASVTLVMRHLEADMSRRSAAVRFSCARTGRLLLSGLLACCRAGPVERRTISSGRRGGSGGGSTPSMSASSCCTASLPWAVKSSRRVVRGGEKYAASGVSSTPVTLTSSGTRWPRSLRARMTPSAV